MDAARLVREARSRVGFTQAQLARLANTSQSAIAAYESGAREPSLAVVERIVRAAGQRVEAALQLAPGFLPVAEVARLIAASVDEAGRLRLFFEFLRSAADDGSPVELLVACRPDSTGDARFDALLAAAAEDLCVHADVPVPRWVRDAGKFLDHMWWISDLPAARAAALVHTPASYRRRGIMIDRRDLVAV